MADFLLLAGTRFEVNFLLKFEGGKLGQLDDFVRGREHPKENCFLGHLEELYVKKVTLDNDWVDRLGRWLCVVVGQTAAEFDKELLQLRHASIIDTNCPHSKQPELNRIGVIKRLGELVVK